MLILGLFQLLLVSAVSYERINGQIINRQASLILLYSFLLAIDSLNLQSIGSGIGVFGGLYSITVLVKYTESFLYLLGSLILCNLYIVKKEKSFSLKSEFSVICLFSIIGTVLLIASNDLISMYLSIELQSFSLYVLATIYRDSQTSTYAGLKYFLLGGLSSAFILLGSTLIYSRTGLTNLNALALIVQSSNNLFSLYQIGLAIMTTGFLFKIASAPFHNWAVDVYDGVPTKVTIWLQVIPKISILIFLTNFYVCSNSSYLNSLLLLGSLLSLLIGTIVGLCQTRIKRLLAYSTISHVGFLLLALALNKEDSFESFIFYLISYSLTSANAFLIIIGFGLILPLIKLDQLYSPISYISDLKGSFMHLHKASPLLVLSLAVVLFSMAGIPPLVGFFAKQAVLLSAVKNGYIFLALVGIITSVISAAYYLKIIKVMVFDNSKISNNNLTIDNELSNSLSFSIAVLTLSTIFFVFKPSLILNGCHLIALNLFYI